ncbi:diguanylate cyclase [Vibrio sp. RC27]
MRKSGPFSWIARHLELKILVSIIIVSVIFIPVASTIAYRHAFQTAQEDAHFRVTQFLSVIESNASVAAYMSDFSLATEIVNGLGTISEINGVIFTLSSGVKLTNGDVRYNSGSDIHVKLRTTFETPKEVGSLDIFINQEFINSQAKEKGLFLVQWQIILIVTVSICFMVLFRMVVSRPIHRLVAQLAEVEIESGEVKPVEVTSNDEIGFLAENMNVMLKKVQDSFSLDSEKNAKIAHLEKQFRMIFEYSHAGIALINAQNKVLLSNPAFEAVFKHNSEKLSQSYYYASDLIDEKAEMEEVIQSVRDQETNIFRDFRVKGHEDVWVRAIFSLIEDKSSESGKFVEMVVYDISDRAKIERHFEYNATHDSLTGLLNRRGGELKFAKQLEYAKESNSAFVMLLLDLNDFKLVNDKHGHEAGDIVLKEIASRLRSVLRADDLVVRWGGDEFVISMILDNLERVNFILEEIHASFALEIEISSTITARVGASIGVSTSVTKGYDLRALLESADDIMYEVKRNGNVNYQIHEADKLDNVVHLP